MRVQPFWGHDAENVVMHLLQTISNSTPDLRTTKQALNQARKIMSSFADGDTQSKYMDLCIELENEIHEFNDRLQDKVDALRTVTRDVLWREKGAKPDYPNFN